MSTASPNRVETIDVFRGVAILLVVLYHFTARLPADAMNVTGAPAPAAYFGWCGVYVFFAISGYCIYLTLERSATLALFLARRFSRLYPAFLAAALFLFAYGMLVPLPSIPDAGFHERVSTLLDLTMNLLFVGDGRWINGSFWSIAVEIKFYAGLALLAALIPDRRRLATVFAWLSLAAAPFWVVAMLYQFATGSRLPQALIGIATIAPYLPFFAIGILARMLKPATPLTITLLALCLVEAALVTLFTGFDGSTDVVAAVVTTVLTMVLLGALVAFAAGMPIPHVPVLSRALAGVGFVSFSWYLLHENLGVSFLFNLNRALPNVLAVPLAMAATLLIAWVFSELVEWRFRKPVEALALRVLNGVAGAINRVRRKTVLTPTL